MQKLLLSSLLLLALCSLVLSDVRSDYSTWDRVGPTPVVRRTGSLPNKFDFIIIGGGTAGCVLANRLSAEKKATVLVIESGTVQDNTNLVSIPINWDRTAFSPVDHSYLNEGKEILNWDGGKRHVAAGKALGGTTAINTMMYVRGNHHDYDNWNTTGWSYNDVLPFFKKAETSSRYSDPSIPDRTVYHGNTGPLKVGPSGWQPAEDQLLVQAANNFGLPFNPDWNGENQIGVGFHEHTIDPQGKRITAFSAYLQPVLSRKNLWVMDNSEAQRINFKTSGPGKPRADSVVFIDHATGNCYTVSAKREVIVSAGALRSPQILQLSGVGPAAELARLGVPLVKDLPGVGQNLQDHPITTMGWVTSIGAPVIGGTADQAAFDQYFQDGTGIVGSISARTNFFFRSSKAVDQRPDAQIISSTPGFTVFCLCYLNKPRSRGHVRLFSKDPSDKPLVTANYFQHPDDLDAMVDIMNKTVQIYKQAPISVLFPFDAAYDMTDVAKLKTYILGDAAQFKPANAGSGYHFVGTNKMGNPATDPMAVVDSRLRVSGILGLRVADASIMPEIVTGNTQAATYMIGEKASDMILADNSF